MTCRKQLRIYRPPRSGGGIGRRAGFRCQWGQPRGGSSPLLSTIYILEDGSETSMISPRTYWLWSFLLAFCVATLPQIVEAKPVPYPAYERHVPGAKLNKYEGKVLRAVRSWSQDKKQRLRYDPRLGKVAKAMARLTAHDANAADHHELRRIAYRQGITDGQVAHVITQGKNSEASIHALLGELKRTLSHVDMTHLGVAIIRKDKVVTAALILSRRLVKLSPIRSFARKGQTAYLRGRFFQKGPARGIQDVQIALTMPSGKVLKQKLQIVDRKFQLPILVGQDTGVIQAQIVVNRGKGPEVAALFPLGIGHTPWAPARSLKSDIDDTMESEPALASLILGARKAQGLNLPAHSSLLAQIARAHAEDMRDHRFFAHVSDRTGDVTHRLSQFQVSYVVALENIASATGPDDIMQEWMNSPSHRANLLSPDITSFGVGISENSENPDGSMLAVAVLVKQEETADTQTLRKLTRERLNQERRRLGLDQLPADTKLDALAQKHSLRVAREHQSKSADSWDADVEEWVLDPSGKANSAMGIYHSTTVDVVLQAEHRLASFKRVGIGIVKDPKNRAAPMWITLMWLAE